MGVFFFFFFIFKRAKAAKFLNSQFDCDKGVDFTFNWELFSGPQRGVKLAEFAFLFYSQT